MANTVAIGKEAVETFFAGNGSVGAVEQPLNDVSLKVLKHIVVRADSDNTDVVIVGPPGHAAGGFILKAGEQTPPIYVEETHNVSVIGGNADQLYSWIAN